MNQSVFTLATGNCQRITQGGLALTISPSFPKLMSIESVMLSNHPILCLDHVQTCNLDFTNLESQPSQMLCRGNLSLGG